MSLVEEEFAEDEAWQVVKAREPGGLRQRLHDDVGTRHQAAGLSIAY